MEYSLMQFPPKDFGKIRELMTLIKQGEIQLEMGRKSQAALIEMINNPDMVATSNIVQLAKSTQVSPASITRLTKLLGFSGFTSFQNLFKQRTKVSNNYYSKKAKDLVVGHKLSGRQMLTNQLESAVKNVETFIAHMDEDKLGSAVKLLTMSRRVYVFGHKQSSAVANVFRYGLCLIRLDVQNLGQYEHGLAIALGQLRKNDLVVIFGSSPYSNLTIDIAAMAHSLSCTVIAITDSSISPLNDSANYSFQVPTDSQYYSNSLSANFIFIESLLSLAAVELGAVATEKLKLHEALVSKINANS